MADGGCPNGYMGAVPISALDPVFYLHHANIDRLYDCWLRVNEAARLPTDPALLERRYSFIDSDGSRRERQVRDMLTTSALRYSYASGSGCHRAPARAPSSPRPRAGRSGRSSRSAAGPTDLARGVTEVALAAALPAGRPGRRRSLRRRTPPSSPSRA